MQTGEWNPPEWKISDNLFVDKLRAGSRIRLLKVPLIMESTQQKLTRFVNCHAKHSLATVCNFECICFSFSWDSPNWRTFSCLKYSFESFLKLVDTTTLLNMLEKAERGRRQKVAKFFLFRNISFFWQVAESRRTKSFYVNRSCRM